MSMDAIWWKTFAGHRSFAAGIIAKCNSAKLRTSELGTINPKLYKYFMSASPKVLDPKRDFALAMMSSGVKPPLLSLISPLMCESNSISLQGMSVAEFKLSSLMIASLG